MPTRDLIERVRKALGDRYNVITAVGRGGNACIFGAYDQVGQKVAIKVLHPELAVSVAADRFLREIRYASQLDHPHIARLLDSGETDYLLWFAMPYLPGETLRQVLRREGRLAVDRATRAACEIDRKSTRLNSSHGYISYAVFCLKKKNERSEELCHDRPYAV